MINDNDQYYLFIEEPFYNPLFTIYSPYYHDRNPRSSPTTNQAPLVTEVPAPNPRRSVRGP